MKKAPKTGTNEITLLRDQLAHALADYDNLRKRVEREKQGFEKLANLRLVMKLLPVLDILYEAQKHLADKGVAITIAQFEDALVQEGIVRIEVKVGDEFDPNLHEVIDVLPSANEEGDEKRILKDVVQEVILSGWKLADGPVMRHAKVKVVKK